MKNNFIQLFKSSDYNFKIPEIVQKDKVNKRNIYEVNIKNNSENSSGKFFLYLGDLCSSCNTININIDSNVPNLDIVEFYTKDIFSFNNCTELNFNIYVGDSTKVNYNIINLNEGSIKINRSIILHNNAVMNHLSGELNGSFATRTEFFLKDSSSLSTKTIMLVGENQKQKHYIRVNHDKKNSTSFMKNDGIVISNGYGEFENVGFIQKGSSKSDAQQQSKILTLDDESRAHIHPILLIDDYDVTAGHAGSVGKISLEQLYYLQSRGLNKRESYFLIVEGILKPIIDSIYNQNIRNNIKDFIYYKLIND